MFTNINETGKIFGIGIIQPKAVRVEYDKWIKENHTHSWMIKFPFVLSLAFLILECQNNTHPSLVVPASVVLLISIIALMILNRQYNKQAPEGLKRR